MTTSNMSKWEVGIIKPSAGTNLCTNPSIELLTTGYTAIASTLTVSADKAYWGQNSLKNAIAGGDANNASGWYYALALTTGTTYYFSAYVWGAVGKTYTIKITDAGGTIKSSTQFTGTGYWQRQYTYWACNSSATYRMTIIRDASQNDTTAFYCDGVQVETAKLTTYIDGTLDAFSTLRGVTEYYWTGADHASTSVRIGETRSGGEEIMLSTYCKILMLLGMGLTTFNTVGVPKTLGGGIYQWSRPNTRAISIPVMFSGANPGEVAEKVREVQNIVDPANKPYQQPLRLYFRPVSADGTTQEGDTAYIDAVYNGGLESVSWQAPTSGPGVLQFTAFLPMIMKDGVYKTALTYQAALTGDVVVRVTQDGTIDNFGITETTTGHIGFKMVKSSSGVYYLGGDFLNLNAIAEADRIAQRSAAGVWSAMGAGLSAPVYDMAIDDSGLLYIVGSFTNAGGAATADYICTWNGSAFASITSGGAANGAINAIAISRVGQIYVAGAFTDIGASGADYIARYSPGDGSWNVIVGATTLTAAVYDIIPDPWGDGVIVAGNFTNVGGDGTKDYLLRVTVSGTTYAYALIGSAAPNGAVYAIHYDEITGRLYAIGNFTTIGGVTAAGVSYYDGTNWNVMGTGVNTSLSVPMRITSENGHVHFAGGGLTTAGGVSLVDGFATWEGNRFHGQKFDVSGGTYTGASVFSDKDTGDLLWLGSIASSTIEGVTSIANSDYADIYPVIQITGPGTVFGIKNYTTKEHLDFNGLTLRAGEVLEIIFTPTGMSKCATPTRDCKPYIVEGSSSTIKLAPGTNKIGLFIYGGTTAATAANISFIQTFSSLENAVR